MRLGAVALVLREGIARIDAVVLDHHPVSGYLGKNGSCSNGKARAIAFDNTGLWNRNFAQGQRIDENMVDTAARLCTQSLLCF